MTKKFKRVLKKTKKKKTIMTCKAQDVAGLQAEKNLAHQQYKKNIAMTDCLQAG